MENVNYGGSNPRNVERLIMIIYTIYSVSMIIMAAGQGWESWTSFFLVVALASGWILYISKYKSFYFRAWYTAAMLEVSIFLYAHEADDISRGLPILIAFVVFVGLYGIVEIIYMTAIFAVVIFFYHGVIVDTISWSTAADVLKIVAQMGNVAIVELVMWLWVKKRNDSSTQMLGIIEELRAAENRKDEFLANVSHEIRTPINTICGMSEIVLRENLPLEVKENLQNIQTAGRNLMSVVSDILDFSELQSGKMELEEEAYNITSTINDVINMSLARKNEKKIELIVDCDANIPCALLGDEKKLRRIIMNLVDNAIKFTEEGCVSINVGYRREDYGINLLVTVKDTGIGISDESLEKMFTSFHQVDASAKRMEGGMGLGLAISHALVRKMGGAITISSKLGKGTTVRFVVPQKVLDEMPIAAIQNRSEVNVATYIDMEQFDMMTIRDEYSQMIINMVEQLRGKCHICRNFAELQRREEKVHFSHIFTSTVEYLEHTAYFDELAKRTNVVVVLNRSEEKYVTNPGLLKIYKPFYILSVVSVLNGTTDGAAKKALGNSEKFVTRNAHVLVVDDNYMNLRVAEGLLSNYNIQVTTASSGQEALEKIMTANYDFVFMDHMMPEMDGVETMHRIRQKVGTYYQKVPIIALTANAVAGTREQLMMEGFSDFLEKPIERSVLERVLKRNLDPEKIIYATMAEGDKAEQEAKKTVPEVNTLPTANIVPPANTLPEQLEALGLDVKKGMLYCGGEEAYINILQDYCGNWIESAMQAQQHFEARDWKNYTIVVHGIKSAMGSVGATEVSALAKQLEMAGKEDRTDYILAMHEDFMKEYQKLFSRLRENKLLCPPFENQSEAEQEDAEGETGIEKTIGEEKKSILNETLEEKELTELSEDKFENLLNEMEDAMYDFREEKLMDILEELQKCRYCGVALEGSVQRAKRKVEMADYMSAVDLMVKEKKHLMSGER